MFLRSSQDEKDLAALNAPQRSLAVIGKCIAILALSIAGVVVIGGDRHVFGPPLIALLLTALVAAILVSLRPRLFLAPFGVVEKDNLPDRVALDITESLLIAMPLPGLLVDRESRKVLAANAAAAELYGHAIEAFQGLPINELGFAAESDIEAEAKSSIDRATRHKRADGSVFWAETRLFRVGQGAQAACLFTVADASERVTLIESLESSERFVEELLALTPGIVFSHDLDGTLRRVNPAFACALGYKQGEMDGQKFSGLLASHQHDAFMTYLGNIQQGQGGTGAIHVQCRNGDERVWGFRNRLSVAPDGSQSVLCFANDISERRRNESRLLENDCICLANAATANA